MTCDLEGSSNVVSTCDYGGVLAGSLVAEFVVLVVAMVISFLIYMCIRKKRFGQIFVMFL